MHKEETPLYVPVLPGRAGEWRALRECTDDVRARMLPVMTVPLAPPDEGEPWDVAPAVDRFCSRLAGSWPKDLPIAVEAIDAREIDVVPVVEIVHRLTQGGHDVVPTVRPSDHPDTLRAVGECIARWQLSSVCIRLAGDDLDDGEQPLADRLTRLLHGLHVAPEASHLVLDLGHVADEAAGSFAARIARLVLGELPDAGRWRTLAVVAGSFPVDLSAVPPEVLTRLTRFEVAMWQRVRDRLHALQPCFGDYAVAHPVASTGTPFAPPPQLRFTQEQSWFVLKGRRNHPRANRQFLDVCAQMAAVCELRPDDWWGDAYVRDAAEGRGPWGNAMMWRAVGTNHHLGYVTRRLATTGEP